MTGARSARTASTSTCAQAAWPPPQVRRSRHERAGARFATYRRGGESPPSLDEVRSPDRSGRGTLDRSLGTAASHAAQHASEPHGRPGKPAARVRASGVDLETTYADVGDGAPGCGASILLHATMNRCSGNVTSAGCCCAPNVPSLARRTGPSCEPLGPSRRGSVFDFPGLGLPSRSHAHAGVAAHA
jgi:hypothetical protein